MINIENDNLIKIKEEEKVDYYDEVIEENALTKNEADKKKEDKEKIDEENKEDDNKKDKKHGQCCIIY